MRIISICAAMLVLGGCAQEALVPAGTAPVVVANTTTDIKPQTKLTCHKESTTGSQMIHTVCEAEQTDAERQATQQKVLDNVRQMQAPQRGTPN